MDYTRQSSQPATVDLVRADLAEVWTAYNSEFSSPKRPGSVSAISDMLDLESIPTPGVRPSKTRKKDPLLDMLVDVLELSPSRKRERSDDRGKATSNRSSNPVDGGSPLNRPSQQTLTPDLPVNSHERATRRQGQSRGKAGASPDAKKGPAKAPNQSKPAPATANPTDTRARIKERWDKEDLFELSDSTDTEEESTPKKRPAKQPSSAKPRAPTARKLRAAEKAAGPPISQRPKPSRVPKKPSRPAEAKEFNAKAGLTPAASAPRHQGNRVIPRTTQYGESGSGGTASSLDNEMTAEAFTFSESPDSFPALMQANEPVPSASPNPLDVITTSSRSKEEGNPPEESTSPLFISDDQVDKITRDDPDILVTVKQGTDTDQSGPRRGPEAKTRLGFTTLAPSQAQLQVDEGGIRQQRGISGELPSGFRDTFFSGQKPAAMHSSPLPEPGPCPGKDESMNPEDIWKQAVGDDTPPEVLRRIVTLLHRSLKPKEEIILEIASDYESNALRLLRNLNARHLDEKVDTLAALRKASRAALSVFYGAGLDMAIHIENLRELDIAHTAGTLKRSALAEKLDTVARLCQTMLNNYHQEGPLSSSIKDDAASGKAEGNEKLDNLAEAYRVRLLGAVQRSNSQALEIHDEVSSQVQEYIARCLGVESKKTHQAIAKKSDGPARTADEALEVLLNRVIGRMQGNGTGCGLSGNASGTVVDIVSEASDSSERGS